MGALAKLSDIQIRKATAADKQRKLSDGGGLVLVVRPDGAKYWQFNYRYHGKQQTLSLGVYPAVSVREARERHQAARAQLAQGENPTATKRLAKITQAEEARHDFEGVARELWEAKLRTGRSAGYVEAIIEKLEKDVFPWIGTRPMAQVQAPEILAILNRVESRAPETARRLRGFNEAARAVLLAWEGLSTAGPRGAYEFHARSAHGQVASRTACKSSRSVRWLRVMISSTSRTRPATICWRRTACRRS